MSLLFCKSLQLRCTFRRRHRKGFSREGQIAYSKKKKKKTHSGNYVENSERTGETTLKIGESNVIN